MDQSKSQVQFDISSKEKYSESVEIQIRKLADLQFLMQQARLKTKVIRVSKRFEIPEFRDLHTRIPFVGVPLDW